MKQTHSFLLLVFLLTSPLALVVLVSCGELSTPGDPLSINSSQPKVAYLDEPYTNLIRVTGGLNSYTYKIDKGALPPGLSLSSVGAIQGTPTKEGTYNFTITVSDANLSKTFADMFLTVQQAPPAQLRLGIPLTEMREEFTVRPEILDARALQGFRTKLTWDAAQFKLVEDSLRTTSDRVIMFDKAEEGILQIDMAVKGEALNGNHRLFTFALEPVDGGFIAVQGQVEFVNQDGKKGFQQLNEGQQNPEDQLENDQSQDDQVQNQEGDQTQIQDNSPTAEEIENGDGSQNGQ